MKIKHLVFLFGAIMLFGCGGKEESWSLKSVYPNFDSSLLKYPQDRKEQYFKDLEFINKNLKNCKLTINEKSISIATRGGNLRKFGLPLDYDFRRSRDTIYVVFPLEHIPTIVKNIYEEQVYFVVLFENKQNLILKYYYLKNSYYNNFIFHFHKED